MHDQIHSSSYSTNLGLNRPLRIAMGADINFPKPDAVVDGSEKSKKDAAKNAPQAHGVTTTFRETSREIEKGGDSVLLLSSDQDRFGLTLQKGLHLELFPQRIVPELRAFQPDRIYIATPGPLGAIMRDDCIVNNLPFAVGHHTRLDDYIAMRLSPSLHIKEPVIRDFVRGYLRWFYEPAAAVLVPTPTIRDELENIGVERVGIWGRGIDTERFKPRTENDPDPYREFRPKTIIGVHTRVEFEKNLEALCELKIPGVSLNDVQIVIIGTGGALPKLREKYPHVHFTGQKTGQDLVNHVAALDVFVLSTLLDTFANTQNEAAACGVPAVVYPAPARGMRSAFIRRRDQVKFLKERNAAALLD